MTAAKRCTDVVVTNQRPTKAIRELPAGLFPNYVASGTEIVLDGRE
jgi:hypothetical protein